MSMAFAAAGKRERGILGQESVAFFVPYVSAKRRRRGDIKWRAEWVSDTSSTRDARSGELI